MSDTLFFTRFHNFSDSLSPQELSAAEGGGRDPEEIRACQEAIALCRRDRVRRYEAQFGGRLYSLYGKKVLFLGDSLTKDRLGYRSAVTEAARLVPLDGSASGRRSPKLLLKARELLEGETPQLISLMIGTNDSVFMGETKEPRVSLSQYKETLSEVLKLCSETSARILLFAIPPIHESRFSARYGDQKHQTNEHIGTYNEVLFSLACQQGIPLLSNEWLLSDADRFFEPDGVHFTAEAQTVFGEKWLSAALSR